MTILPRETVQAALERALKLDPCPDAAARAVAQALAHRHMAEPDCAALLEEAAAALAAHEAEKQTVEHRPGCDALGGYGHGVGTCNCGADEAEKQAGPVAGQVVYLHRLSKFEGGKWVPATELIAGEPAPEWAELAASKPDLWRVDRRVTGVEIARGLVRAVQASATDTTPPSPLAEQDKVNAELLADIELVLDDPGIDETAQGSFHSERTRCHGCRAEADGWGVDLRGLHKPGCKAEAAQMAESRLREAIRAARAKKEPQ